MFSIQQPLLAAALPEATNDPTPPAMIELFVWHYVLIGLLLIFLIVCAVFSGLALARDVPISTGPLNVVIETIIIPVDGPTLQTGEGVTVATDNVISLTPIPSGTMMANSRATFAPPKATTPYDAFSIPLGNNGAQRRPGSHQQVLVTTRAGDPPTWVDYPPATFAASVNVTPNMYGTVTGSLSLLPNNITHTFILTNQLQSLVGQPNVLWSFVVVGEVSTSSSRMTEGTAEINLSNVVPHGFTMQQSKDNLDVMGTGLNFRRYNGGFGITTALTRAYAREANVIQLQTYSLAQAYTSVIGYSIPCQVVLERNPA
jgi:hypothetical protein